MVSFFARLFGYLAAFFLTATMMITVADVFLRTFFGYPVRGVLELSGFTSILKVFADVDGAVASYSS